MFRMGTGVSREWNEHPYMPPVALVRFSIVGEQIVFFKMAAGEDIPSHRQAEALHAHPLRIYA
jgi:hypothetical protein